MSEEIPWLVSATEEKLLLARLLTPVKQLGEGACGRVLLCSSPRGPLAVKVLRRTATPNAPSWPAQSLTREAQLLGRIRHPNILASHGVINSRDHTHLMLKLEYCEKGSLDELLKVRWRDPERPLVPEEMVWRWAAQLSSALAYLHFHHIVHRDVKPRNILVAADDTLRLGDFGNAKELHGEDDTMEHHAGTSYYLAPELCARELYDNRCDTWALGCTIHEICTLRKTFSGGSFEEVVQRVLTGQRRPIDRAFYSPELANFIDLLLTYSNLRRPRMREIVTIPAILDILAKKTVTSATRSHRSGTPPMDEEHLTSATDSSLATQHVADADLSEAGDSTNSTATTTTTTGQARPRSGSGSIQHPALDDTLSGDDLSVENVAPVLAIHHRHTSAPVAPGAPLLLATSPPSSPPHTVAAAAATAPIPLSPLISPRGGATTTTGKGGLRGLIPLQSPSSSLPPPSGARGQRAASMPFSAGHVESSSLFVGGGTSKRHVSAEVRSRQDQALRDLRAAYTVDP